MRNLTRSDAEIGALVAKFDELDHRERPRFSDEDDRVWLWSQNRGSQDHFEDFKGYEDITQWMNGALQHDRGGYIPRAMREPFLDQSYEFDKPFIGSMDVTAYRKHVGEWNADDFIYANAYPVPEWQRAECVLDFGAGYGRQANLWSQNVEGLRLISMDVIRKPYLCAALYYERCDLPVREYLTETESFEIQADPGVYHLPAWRWDLVPDESVDMVLAAMVLPELHKSTLIKTLGHFARVVRPGGAIFIRDHGLIVKSANTYDIASELSRLGFVLEFRPYVNDQSDLRGVPRIWRRRKEGVLVPDEVR